MYVRAGMQTGHVTHCGRSDLVPRILSWLMDELKVHEIYDTH